MYTSRAKTNLSASIYRLKHEMGEPITWLERTGTTVDYDTGIMTETTVEIPIHRAIVLPIEMIQKAKYSITFLAANKNFVYDGLYEKSKLGVLIDLRDIPFRDFEKRGEDRVRLQNGNVFEITSRDYYGMEIALILELQEVTNG